MNKSQNNGLNSAHYYQIILTNKVAMKKIFSLLAIIPVLYQPAYSWNYEAAPYIWASGLDGTQQTGDHRFHVHETFSDLLKHLDFGAMLYLAAYQNDFGVFFNGIYSKVSDHTVLDNLAIDTKSAMTIDSAGASYKFRPFMNKSWIIEPYTGARYTLNDAKVSIDALSARQKYNWTDAIIGSRIYYIINPSFNFEGSADYGRGSHSFSYNLSALLGYQSKTHFKNTRFYIGYRFLHQYYHHGQDKRYYLWNMNLYGPVAGFSYRF